MIGASIDIWHHEGGGTVVQDDKLLGVISFRDVAKAVLEAAGSSLDKVVKVTIYMVDLAELPEMNAVFIVLS